MGTQDAMGRFGRGGNRVGRAASIAEPAFWHKKTSGASLFEWVRKERGGIYVDFSQADSGRLRRLDNPDKNNVKL
jgi:hypothetical protein